MGRTENALKERENCLRQKQLELLSAPGKGHCLEESVRIRIEVSPEQMEEAGLHVYETNFKPAHPFSVWQELL